MEPGWEKKALACPHGCGDTGAHNWCPIAVAVERMTVADREWFESHPGATEYYRPLKPGDIESSSLRALMGDDVPKVRVRQIRPGFRVRNIPGGFGLVVPPSELGGRDDDIAMAEALRWMLITSGRFKRLTTAQYVPDESKPWRPQLPESPAEESLWGAYLKRELRFHMTPQHKVGRYRLDFAIVDKKVAIEVDGLTYHNGQESFIRDQQRQRDLQAAGWKVIRFAAKEALDNPQRCLAEIERLIP